MAPMYERVIRVISRPAGERASVEINMLVPWLRKSCEILNNVKDVVLVDLLRHCDYSRVPTDTIIIRQGDIGDCFYIMLTGSTSVYVDPVKTGEGPSSSPPPPKKRSKKPEKSTNKEGTNEEDVLKEEEGEEEEEEEDDEDDDDEDDDDSLDRSTLGKFMVRFGAGKTFGDVALISDNARRNASVVADEETDLLCISRDLFNRSLRMKQEQEYKDRRAFIAASPLFKHWNPKFRRLLEMSLRKETFQFGAPIVRQGDSVQGLHFIISGHAQVTVRPGQHKHQYPKYFEPPSSAIAKELAKHENKGKLPDLTTEEAAATEQAKPRTGGRINGVKQPIQKTHIRVRRKEGYAAAEKRLADQSVTISCLDKNEVIGDVEIIMALDTYSNTVTCTANTECFLLDVKNLERLVYKKNLATMNKLTQAVEDKLHARMNSNQVGQSVPVYKHLYDRLQEIKPAPQTGGKDVSGGTSSKSAKDSMGNKEQCMSQLIKLFLKDRASLVAPAVPGTLYYMSKSVKRAERQEMQAKRKADENALSANVRLERARKYVRRKPLSRRELERLCAGEPVDYMKQYSQNKDHAIGRILNLHPTNVRPAVHQRMSVGQPPPGRTRPHTALGVTSPTTPTIPESQPLTASTPLPRPTRVDVDTAVGGLFDMSEFQDEPDGAQFDMSDELDEEMLRSVMAGMGGYQKVRNNARTKVICSMLDKRASQSPMNGLLQRPKSAMSNGDDGAEGSELPQDAAEHLDHDEDVHFDWDTSEPALKTLEDKIKGFLDKYDHMAAGISEADTTCRKTSASVTELKRFTVEGPDDIPIPGGTVYVRQKACKYPMGVSCPSHQHIRRYMIPKNAYSLATKSLAEISKSRANQQQQQQQQQATGSVRRGSSMGQTAGHSGSIVMRPTTAPVRSRHGRSTGASGTGRLSSMSTHSAWG